MAEQNEVEEIQEPEQVIEQAPQHQSDTIPLKDQFDSDLSEIDFVEFTEKQEEIQTSSKAMDMKPKKKKIIKNYRWKNKWVTIPNIIEGSAPLLQKRWVKVKYVPTQDQLTTVHRQQIIEKDRGALSMAQAIILQQLTNHQ